MAIRILSSENITGKLTLTGQQELLELTRGGASDSKWFFSADSAKLYIAENTSASNNIKMTLTDAGNIGIGTLTPNSALQVNQTSSVPIIVHRPDNTNFYPHGIGFSTRNDSANGGLGDVRAGIFYDYNGRLFLSASTAVMVYYGNLWLSIPAIYVFLQAPFAWIHNSYCSYHCF